MKAELETALRANQRQQETEQFLSAARELYGQGQLEQSLAAIAAGLASQPDHPALLSLRQKLQSELATQQNQEQAQQYLAQARSYQQQDLLDDSLAAIKQGLSLAPGQTDLLALREQIEQQQQNTDTVARVLELQQSGALIEALAMTVQALATQPDQAELLALQDELGVQLATAPVPATDDASNAGGATTAIATDTAIDTADAYLQTAQKQLQQGQLEASLDSVNQGLELEPENESLIALQNNIIDTIEEDQQLSEFIQQARQEQQTGNLAEGLATVNKGLALNPENQSLLALRTTLEQQITGQADADPALDDQDEDIDEDLQAESEVDQLLAQAAVQMKRNRLTSPASDNAYKTYREILQLEPDNADAKRGIRRIASTYLRWAGNSRDRGNYSKSLTQIDKGLRVAPGDQKLNQLRQDVLGLQAAASRPIVTTRPAPQPTYTPTPAPRPKVDPCAKNRSSKACWCKTFGMFCN